MTETILAGMVVTSHSESDLQSSAFWNVRVAFEGITSVERMVIRFGDKTKIVTLCRTYMEAAKGLNIQMETLPQLLIADTFGP